MTNIEIIEALEVLGSEERKRVETFIQDKSAKVLKRRIYEKLCACAQLIKCSKITELKGNHYEISIFKFNNEFYYTVVRDAEPLTVINLNQY